MGSWSTQNREEFVYVEICNFNFGLDAAELSFNCSYRQGDVSSAFGKQALKHNGLYGSSIITIIV